MSEARLQASIKKALEDIGCIVQKIQPPPVGVPDLLVIYAPSQHFWIEVKTATGKLSKPQQAFHKWLELKHENVYIVRTPKDAVELARGFQSKRLPEASDCGNHQAA